MGAGWGAPKKNLIPDEVTFKSKPEIAIEQIDRLLKNGIRVMAWNADEAYGRDGFFLDALDARHQAFVCEAPGTFTVWLKYPKVGRKSEKRDYRRIKRLRESDEKPTRIRDVVVTSPTFKHQSPQRYIVRISNKGEEVWEIRWAICWRKTHTMKMVSNPCTLVVARNVLTNETKFFISNRVPGSNGWSLRKTLKVAFSRWPVEDCFREAKEELGLDHFECRSWKCIHRHYFVTLLGHLFCAHTRKKLSKTEDVTSDEYLTVEQIRRAVNANLGATTDPPRVRASKYKAEYDIQSYYQKRNAYAIKSHRKKRRAAFKALGINIHTTKSIYDTKKRRSKPRKLALSN